MKGFKALKEKNLEDKNLKILRESVLSIYGEDIFNAPENVLRKTEEGLERITEEEEEIKLFLEAMENEKVKVFLKEQTADESE